MGLKLFIVWFLLLSVLRVSLVHAAIMGDPVTVGAGTARTYVEIQKNGSPAGIGVVLSASALSNLPSDQMMFSYELKLPVREDLRPFDHVVLNWNPMGHEPTEIYGAPHFDFHFYMIPSEVQKAITCDAADKSICLKPVAPEYVPSDYAPGPGGVPTMGWHWIDTLSGEWHGLPFTSTFIYGYYNGMLSFIEPMITRKFLLEKTDLSAAIRLPAKFPYPGNYPSSYSIQYITSEDAYHITLQNFGTH